MIRRISTKWMLAVLAVVAVPFLGLAVFVSVRVSNYLTTEVVNYNLLSQAADLADSVDAKLQERVRVAEMLAEVPFLGLALDDRPDREVFLPRVEGYFDKLVTSLEAFDFILAIDLKGRAIAGNHRGRDGLAVPAEQRSAMMNQDYSGLEWFRSAVREQNKSVLLDHHRFAFGKTRAEGSEVNPEDYQIAIARAVSSDGTFAGAEQGDCIGVIYMLVNWLTFQEEIADYGVRGLHGQGRTGGDSSSGVGRDIYETSYAWIWSADADTIIAHKNPNLYGQRVSADPVSLPELVAAARSAPWGMYPEYTFNNVRKNAAFKHCQPREEGGLGWVVGVGVDRDDVLGPVNSLLGQLATAMAFVLGVAILLTALVAKHTTRPIKELVWHTKRIAGGDLDARIEVSSRDELGDLARAFNDMTAELKASRQRLVKAEKDAAWREMARQVAHEIKNPLTPISLSAGLLRRARKESPEKFDSIFEGTIDMIQRQVEQMRGIAQDFFAFAGEHKESSDFDAAEIAREVFETNAAWAEQTGVQSSFTGAPSKVHGDPDEFRRALINLMSNAIEAMPNGGSLSIVVEASGEDVLIELTDSGVGLSAGASEVIFDPYFTTRSSGTGLGLAIVRRVVEEMGGRVSLENRKGSSGAVARILLPRVV